MESESHKVVLGFFVLSLLVEFFEILGMVFNTSFFFFSSTALSIPNLLCLCAVS
jgi:hypothetical protein